MIRNSLEIFIQIADEVHLEKYYTSQKNIAAILEEMYHAPLIIFSCLFFYFI